MNLIKNSDIIIQMLSIFMPIIVLLSFVLYFAKKNKSLLIFVIYTIASMIVIYPISDKVHFTIGIFPGFVIIAYIFDRLLKLKIENKKVEVFLGTFIEIVAIRIYIFLFCKISKYLYTKQ